MHGKMGGGVVALPQVSDSRDPANKDPGFLHDVFIYDRTIKKYIYMCCFHEKGELQSTLSLRRGHT